MGAFRRVFWLKPVALYLAIACLIMTTLPADSMAYIVQTSETAYSRSADMATIQRVLEDKVVSQRLMELGLSADEVESRLTRLSDGELHNIASRLDTLYPGGDVVSTLIGLLIVAILVMILLHLTGHRIIIK